MEYFLLIVTVSSTTSQLVVMGTSMRNLIDRERRVGLVTSSIYIYISLSSVYRRKSTS